VFLGASFCRQQRQSLLLGPAGSLEHASSACTICNQQGVPARFLACSAFGATELLLLLLKLLKSTDWSNLHRIPHLLKKIECSHIFNKA
jgi:hypothetical protein